MTVYILYDNLNSDVYGVYAKKEDAMNQAIELVRESGGSDIPEEIYEIDLCDYELQLIEAEVQ